MNYTKEGQSLGGRNASQKVYYCDKCGGIGSGNRMISDHLAGDCQGIQGRKLKKSTEKNSHRLEEAIVNTREWQAQKQIELANQMAREHKAKVLASLEELRTVNNQVMSEAFETYYSKIY